MREYFLKSQRIGFSIWKKGDIELANLVWGEADVTRFICATGKFTKHDVIKRLKIEIQNEKLHHIQYWPIFELATSKLIGCCGIRPFKTDMHNYEIGFHLRKQFWGKGYAFEAANAVINYSFEVLNATRLYTGHHPQNAASEKLLEKLGFRFIGANFYEPTGLCHPSYELDLKK